MIIIEQDNSLIVTKDGTNMVDYTIENIKNLIYTIRGKQVMLDSDVAMLYNYETKNINKAMKRNIDRFPEDFCFQLNLNELNEMWFQNGTTLEKTKYRSEKYLPYVYTEQGVSMLAGILKNETAIQVSINIMRAFVEMRKFISLNGQVFERLTNVEYQILEHNKKFDIVFNELQKDKEEEFKQKIFFDGQIYDAYSLIIDIIKTAQSKILIIDNYIDDSILKMLSKKNKDVEVVILTSSNSNIRKIDIQKFNSQYPSLKMSYTNKFHDRFIVIDNKELYHCRSIIKRFREEVFCNFKDRR